MAEPWIGIRRRVVRSSRCSGSFTALAVLPLACATWLAASAQAQLPCSYSVTILPQYHCGEFAGAGNPIAINSLGHVLLTTANCGIPGYSDTLLWTGGPTLTLIPRPAYMLGFAGTDLNDHGIIVGTAVTTYAGQRGFMFSRFTGEWTEFPPLNPPTGWSGANAINNNNEVCGYRSIGGPSGPINPQTAFVWRPQNGGVFTDLGVLNGPNSSALAISSTSSVVGFTGSSAASANALAFIHENGNTQVLPPVPSGTTSVARAATSDGRVLVTGRVGPPSNYVVRSFRYDKGEWMQLLPLKGDTYTVAGRMTESGMVVGASRILVAGSPVDHPALWIGPQPVDLRDRVNAPPGFVLKNAFDIADSGEILCSATQGGVNVTVVLHPEARVAGDTNCDGTVNVVDLLGVIAAWGPCLGCLADLDDDGFVNVGDLLIVVGNWGT